MKYYLIGIKGSGMSALACLLHDLGHQVIGYDDSTGYKFTMAGLDDRKIKIYHDELPVLDKDVLVVHTAAISDSHPEVVRVRKLGLTIVPYKKVLANLTRQMESICVSGTHGKTTTSLMISSILNKALGCSYFVGDGTGCGNLESNLFVIESCEFNKHFLEYIPYNTVITNIELDHTETYPTVDDMIVAFQEFADKTQNYVIVCGDDANAKRLHIKKKLTYGFTPCNDLVIKNKKVLDNKTMFDVYYHDELFDHYQVKMFGNHLLLDCCASILMGIIYGVSKDIIKETLENFVPAKRRFNETIIGSNVIIDDYAHHPTEISVTYDSAHEKYPDKKIYAIFLPNTYSRTMALFDDFVQALKKYDKAYLMEIDCDREKKEDYPNVSSSQIVKAIAGSEMIDIETLSKLKKMQNTVFCFMSCAYISPMVSKMKELLEEEKKNN